MKKTTLVILLLACLYATLITFCTDIPLPSTDPITVIGHGDIWDEKGQKVKVTKQFIEIVQKFYLNKLKQAIESKETEVYLSKEEIDKTLKTINNEVSDDILANAIYMDWLLEKSKPKQNLSQYTMVNNAMRWEYVLKIQTNGVKPENNQWSKGLKTGIAQKLEKAIGISILALTNAKGEAYCKECLDKGVPVPNSMFGSEWKYMGDIENVFISPGLKAELWVYESQNPKGICLALPRFNSDNKAELFGVICLGTETSKACFFDNPRGTYYKRGEQLDFKKFFLGGTDLVANAQGECTDCHAGENPYIVHPEQKVFMAVSGKIMPRAWHDPLVAASWRQNPGPTNILDAVPSTRNCNGCHVAGNAGRFPDVSQLSQYCSAVLKNATTIKNTMPPYGGNRSQYINHINALENACGSGRGEPGVVVDATGLDTDNTGFISPPIVFGPIYQCATSVIVRGAILDAKVDLFVNGTLVKTISPARNPEKIEFTGLSALNKDDEVQAIQEFNGAIPVKSNKVIVKDHREDYPTGLPAPRIDPTLLYECSEVMAVRHVPSANITIFSNDAQPITYFSAGDWTITPPSKRPFVIGDKFTAKISICGDSSPISLPVTVVKALTSIPPGNFEPPTFYNGQELVTLVNLTNGTTTTVGASGFGDIGKFSTPISWHNNFDVKKSALGRALTTGDRLLINQVLCSVESKFESPRTNDCEQLPAPRIDHPIVGTNYVVVTNWVPGARIRVYVFDGTNNVEIGDGSGTVIVLSRNLTGTDILTVVQQVGKCTSRQGYRVSVRNPSSVKDNK